MKKYNIAKPMEYVKNGEKKTFWANVGTLTDFEKADGSISMVVEIPAIGLKANVFPIVSKDAKKDINESDSPF